MFRTMFKAKIHRAVVTHADLNYEGSVAIDRDLMDAADILPNEVVNIWNVTNGERFDTYAIPAPRGSGMVCINGAAAHKARVNDIVIIATYAVMDEQSARKHEPTVVFVDEKNKIRQKRDFEYIAGGVAVGK